jgi:L-arabinonolactonase
MEYIVEHICHVQAELGEGPVWHPDEQALYFVDILGGRQYRYDPVRGELSMQDIGVMTGSMGIRASGGWVMATKKGFAFFEPSRGQLSLIDDPDSSPGEVRFNDGKTDPLGRFWAGKMGDGTNNCLYRLDADLSIHRMESGIGVSNGLGWSPDLKTFYYTDSPAYKIYAYDFDAPGGKISNRRIFADVPRDEGSPDGLAVDSEGCIWSARWDGWGVVRYRPDGSVNAVIPMPVERPTSCAFGGLNLDELYITSAFVDETNPRRRDQPLMGDLFRIKTRVKGLPEPKFKG